MTWSFAVSNGDLTLAASSYGTVTGEQKLVQDLRCYILEKMGTDNAHPDFGSLLDGGVSADGKTQKGVIGQPINAATELAIQTELQRLITSYQSQQLQRARDDRTVYGKTTLSMGEVLLGVQEIDFQQVNDTLNISIVLETANDTNIDLQLQLPA